MSAPRLAFLDGTARMMCAALGDRLAPGVETYLDLFFDDAVAEFPYGRPIDGDRAEGKEAIAAYLEKRRGTAMQEKTTLTAAYGAGDTVVLEYRGAFRAAQHHSHFVQSYIAVVVMREGRIARFREYANPLLMQQAAGISD